MITRIPALFLAAFILAAPVAEAQINADIPETDTPEGPIGGSPEAEDWCRRCCNGEIQDNTCCRDCGCCTDNGICEGYSFMRDAGISATVTVAVLKSIGIADQRLARTARGSAMRSVLLANARRLSEIYAANPALRERTGRAMARYWPHDMWTSTGAGAHRVSRRALRELRMILTGVARADKAAGGSDIARTIETAVLPNLTPELVGKPYHLAFDCFIGARTCQ